MMTSLRVALFYLLLLLASMFPENYGVATSKNDSDGDNDDDDDVWSKCACPASETDYDATTRHHHRPPTTARMAYLISVHNRRTIHDAAYLLKALMETSHPGNTAVILIHVDARAGIDTTSKVDADENKKDRFLYRDSALRRYVDACHAAPACTTGNNGRLGTINDKSPSSDDNVTTTVLEVHSHFSPEWSKWSMNDPTLWAMDYLVHHTRLGGGRRRQSDEGSESDIGSGLSSTSRRSWDVFVNLSGDTLPVVTAERISALFDPERGPLGNTNFVTSSSCATGLVPTSIFDFPKGTMKRGHYFQRNVPKRLEHVVDLSTGERRADVETPIHFGSQWMALTGDFVEHVIRSMDHPNGLGSVLREMLIETEVLMTDETFFATMLMNSPAFADTIPVTNDDGALERYPSMRALRYERMDENAPDAWGEYVSSDPLYDVPPKFSDATGGEGPARPWGPYFLGTYDLGAIRDSGALFVRKVSAFVDDNLVRMLPVRIDDDANRRRSEASSAHYTAGKGKEELSEWDLLPDIRWPKLGVNIRDPFVWAVQANEAEEEDEEEEED